jgi:hypothetical protein
VLVCSRREHEQQKKAEQQTPNIGFFTSNMLALASSQW